MLGDGPYLFGGTVRTSGSGVIRTNHPSGSSHADPTLSNLTRWSASVPAVKSATHTFDGGADWVRAELCLDGSALSSSAHPVTVATALDADGHLLLSVEARRAGAGLEVRWGAPAPATVDWVPLSGTRLDLEWTRGSAATLVSGGTLLGEPFEPGDRVVALLRLTGTRGERVSPHALRDQPAAGMP